MAASRRPLGEWMLAAAGIVVVVALAADLRRLWDPRAFVRLRYRCATAPIRVDSALRLLQASEVWRELRPYFCRPQYIDHWRVGCWRFFAYEAAWGGRPATAVFAVRLARWRQAVAGAIVDDATDAVLLERTAPRKLGWRRQAALALSGSRL